jgi:thiol-disulfide isomerase/thioredoxin
LSATLEQSGRDEAQPARSAEGDDRTTPGRAELRGGRSRSDRERPFKIIALSVTAALVGFIVFVVVHAHSGQPPRSFPTTRPSSLSVGARAPDFALPRLGGGPTVSLRTGDGEPTMVNFFASWCTDCRQELRAVATVATELRGTVATIGIDTSDTKSATAERLLAGAGAAYPVGEDPGATTASDYRITGLPVTFLVSPKDKVLGVKFGPQTERSLLRWVHALTRGDGPR